MLIMTKSLMTDRVQLLFQFPKTNFLNFSLIFYCSIWNDPISKYQRMSIAILLPTSIGENFVLKVKMYRSLLYYGAHQWFSCHN